LRSSLITFTAVTIVLLASTSSGAIPDPDPLYSPAEHVAVRYPFGAASSPVDHVPGEDWLPARRAG